MAKNDVQRPDFTKATDDMMLLLESIVKEMFKLSKFNALHQGATKESEVPTTESDQLNEPPQALAVQKPVIEEENPMNNIVKLMESFLVTQKEVISIINEPSHENEMDLPSLDKEHEVAEKDIVSGLDQLKQMVIESEMEMSAIAVAAEGITRYSALKRLGEQLIQLDEKREALSNKISDYFNSLPGRIKERFASLVVGSLQEITNKMENLTQKLSDCITPKTELLPDPKLITEEISLTPKDQGVIDINSAADDKSLIEKIKEMLGALEKDIATINTDVKYLEFAFKSKDANIADIKPLVGIRTELDPKVGTFEALNGNEKSGLKTVASVKEEIEDVTLTDYSHHEEEAYHEGVDPDPDVATIPMDEEWIPTDEEYDRMFGYDHER